MKLIGYYPDKDPNIEGIIVDCNHFIPGEAGYESAIRWSGSFSWDVANIRSAFTFINSNKEYDFTPNDTSPSVRVFAGAATANDAKVYEISLTSSALVYTQTALLDDETINFVQFGNRLLIHNPRDGITIVDPYNADITVPSVKARILASVNNFVFAFGTIDTSVNPEEFDNEAWMCSAIDDPTDWTPSVSTQSQAGRLSSPPGRIVAAVPFGENMVAYKERSVFIAYYGGGLWTWVPIAGSAGCVSQYGVVDIGTPEMPVHMFMGLDNFWMFDGRNIIPIGDGINKTVFADFDFNYAYKVRVGHDRKRSRVYFYYPSKTESVGKCGKCVVYHYHKKQWGRDDGEPAITTDYDIGAIFSYKEPDNRPNSADDQIYEARITSEVGFMKFIDQTTTPSYWSSTFTTGFLGDNENYYLLQRVKPKWITKPTSATMVNYYADCFGDAVTEDATTTMSESRFDVLRASRVHQFTFNTSGKMELNEINITYDMDGEE